MSSYYTIVDITTKSGKLKPVHESVLGRRCLLLGGIIIGKPLWLFCDIERDPSRLHRLRTSALEVATMTEPGVLILETMNTTYTLHSGNNPKIYVDLYNRCPHGWQPY